ncbi:extracellular serine carboxypeptidase [Phakopsora pachyrhizi]|nr:extracellular serine carboxypeptidase [Phakopsora pachyrhizi]
MSYRLNNRRPAQHVFEQLISHFNKSETGKFSQRYWYDDTFYKPGGPVIVLDGGETSGEDRLPFLRTGILNVLARVTNGIGIVLEHRYYGKSHPFKDLSVESLRYLNTLESLEDSAYFAKNLVLNLNDKNSSQGGNNQSVLNLTAPATPWIYYGGSYAGAKAAFMIKLYPDLIWGSIASSAVVHAQVDFWQYYEPIRKSAPSKCIKPLIKITKSIDQILSNKKDQESIRSLKNVFQLGNLTDNVDFVNILSSPLGSWQLRNWDPEVGSQAFEHFCDALASGSNANDLVFESREKYSSLFPIEGFEDEKEDINIKEDEEDEYSIALPSLIGYINFIRENISNQCNGMTQDQCFGTNDLESYQKDDISQTWRPWMWQVCTEWGFFQNSPPEEFESIRLISKFIDLHYNSKICRLAFGKSVPNSPKVEQINKYGDFGLNHSRLAYIDGSDDPWLYATPHSPLHKINKKSSKNYWLIKGGVHHWDENGQNTTLRTEIDAEEPPEIKKIHLKEIEWVKSWIKEFYSQKEVKKK